ncbi:transposase (plasmid) [Rhodococcus erythropolis]|uniref:Transposase n=1 Tax=Rhodococcus erythropolis TaxID=1833 RepID=A0A6G9D3Y7_RHOER|nr:transposase [Rhodococcus erythropolis]
MVIPIWDKTLPTVAACWMRHSAAWAGFGLCPHDNEKTATIDHVAGIAVRNPEIVEVARHYGTTLRTCLPADPESKGGSEATVRIAKADLLPKEVNLREQYHSFGELESACRQFCTDVNTRVHSSTRRRPVERLAEELQRLHPLPKSPFTAVFGTTPAGELGVDDLGGRVRYSVPHTLIDTRVWARFHGEELIVTAVDNDGGAVEVARHAAANPVHRSSTTTTTHPAQTATPPTGAQASYRRRARLPTVGPGCQQLLVEAAAAGARRIRAKMAEAVDLSKLHSPDAVDRALGTAAMTGRFADRDLISILDYQVTHEHADPVRRSENTLCNRAPPPGPPSARHQRRPAQPLLTMKR